MQREEGTGGIGKRGGGVGGRAGGGRGAITSHNFTLCTTKEEFIFVGSNSGQTEGRGQNTLVPRGCPQTTTLKVE